MKYKLLKKWHPSQVEEVGVGVGHVFEEDEFENIVYKYNRKERSTAHIRLAPHEIALLVDAGYLEKEEMTGRCIQCKLEGNKGLCDREDCSGYKNDHTIDIWTTEPPKGTVYEYITSYGNVGWCLWQGNEWDKFRLKTGNCHKTSESAKEVLKRLLV